MFHQTIYFEFLRVISKEVENKAFQKFLYSMNFLFDKKKISYRNFYHRVFWVSVAIYQDSDYLSSKNSVFIILISGNVLEGAKKENTYRSGKCVHIKQMTD